MKLLPKVQVLGGLDQDKCNSLLSVYMEATLQQMQKHGQFPPLNDEHNIDIMTPVFASKKTAQVNFPGYYYN